MIAFGGDALLVLFTGCDADGRAAATARDLQTEMAAHAPLRARIGAAAGNVDCYRIGKRQRAIAVAGAVVTETLRCERRARAGEIVTSPSIARTEYGPGRAPAGGALRTWFPGVSAYVAPALRNWLRVGVGDGEYRPLATGFIALTGLDRIRATGGPAAVAAALQRLASACEGVTATHELRWINTDAVANGVKVTLVAGIPVLGEHDDTRLLAGLGDALGELSGLDVHAGATSGRSFVGEVGNGARRGLLVMGDPVNLAARLAARAPRGALLADAAIARRVPDARRTPFGSVTVRGFREPVRVVRIVGRRERVPPPRAPKPPLAFRGRRNECRTLFALMDAAERGRGSVAEIVGEPGLGKSRVLGELRARARPSTVVTITASPQTGLAYTAIGTALDGRLREPLTGRRPDASASDADLRARHEQVVAELAGARLVILVEDAQWLDDASRALVQELAAAAAGERWFVCATRRPNGPSAFDPRAAVCSVRLRALDAPAIRAIARDAARPRMLTGARLDRIARAAHGNPLFAEQLAAADGSDTRVPDRVERVIAARIDRLPADWRDRLRDAAVGGREVSMSLLGAIVGDELPATGWDALGSLVEFPAPGTLRFEHELVRQVAYEGLSFSRRRVLHGRALEWHLARQRGTSDAGALAAISYHAAGAGRDDLAWRWCRRAGAAAAAGGAFHDAVVHYDRALTAAGGLVDVPAAARAATAEALGDAADRAGEPARAASAYRRARREFTSDVRACALLASKLGVLAERAGQYSRAHHWFRTGLRELDAMQPSADTDVVRARLLLDTGSLRQYQGRYAAAIDAARAAGALARARRRRPLVAESEMQLEMALGEIGDPASEVHFARAERALRHLGDNENLATLYVSGGVTARNAGRWNLADSRYDAALGALRTGGHVGARATVRNNQGLLLFDRGYYADARVAVEAAQHDWAALGFEYGVAVATMTLGRIAAVEGDPARARTQFRRARAALARLGTSGHDDELAVYGVERLVATGCWAAALRAVPRARRVLAAGGQPLLTVTLTRLRGGALARSGRREPGAVVLAAALAAARAADAPGEIAFCLDALIASGERDPEMRSERDALARELGIARFPFRARVTAPVRPADRRRAR